MYERRKQIKLLSFSLSFGVKQYQNKKQIASVEKNGFLRQILLHMMRTVFFVPVTLHVDYFYSVTVLMDSIFCALGTPAIKKSYKSWLM
jgi:hypothetical protein